jgi:hypothetical protein
LEKLEQFSNNNNLKETYLEYLVSNKSTEERFHTKLALHYIKQIQNLMEDQENKREEKSKLSNFSLHLLMIFNRRNTYQ